MKATLKRIGISLIAAVLACLCLVGCGAIAIEDIKGDWTIDTINGMSLADYAASVGMDEDTCALNWTISDDKKLTTTNAVGSTTLDMELKSNGFEVMENGKLAFSVEFNKDAGTLTYSVDANGNKVTTVMKKGTYTPSNASEGEESGDAEEATDGDSEEAEEADDASEGEDAEGEESEDDGSEDDGSEDDGSEEEEE